MSAFSRIANVFRAGRLDAELDEELRFHFAKRIEHLTAGGMDPKEAAAFVQRRFGNRLRLRESSHDVKVLRWLESLLQDVRFGARMLWKDRTAMAAAVISLSLSVGACSTAFSLLDGLILRRLAGVGLNGVIGYFVARRTKEIGIRLALGAERPDVVRLIVRNVAMLIALGIAAGIGGSFALSRYAESLLFDVKPTDFLSLALPLAGLLAACILAAFSPAVRAARLDPVTTLRYE